MASPPAAESSSMAGTAAGPVRRWMPGAYEISLRGNSDNGNHRPIYRRGHARLLALAGRGDALRHHPFGRDDRAGGGWARRGGGGLALPGTEPAAPAAGGAAALGAAGDGRRLRHGHPARLWRFGAPGRHGDLALGGDRDPQEEEGGRRRGRQGW